VYALLIRPLPYSNPDRLVEISEAYPQKGIYGNPLVSPDFVAARSSLKPFQSLAGFSSRGDENLTGTGDPIRVEAVGITANFLPELYVTPELGRNFLSSEDRMDGPAVVLLSHRLWKSKFDGEPAVIGRSITLGGKAWIVVGVLPARFIFPDSTLEPDLYVPAAYDVDTTIGPRTRVYMVRVIGRLRDGANIRQANSDLKLFAENRAKGYPAELVHWSEGRTIVAEPLHRYLTGDDRKPLLVLLACVGAVLLIACANVANLQLARSVSRQHETALRGALGAGRLRLMRQFMVESLTLAAMAAVLGVAIAAAVTWLIRRGGMPGEFGARSRFAELLQVPFGKLSAAVDVNGWVLAFTAGLALLTTILFGLAPAIGASRSDLRTALQSSARRISGSSQQRSLRSVLLMAEIGLAVLLLTGAGLLIRSFANVLRRDPGFDPRQCLSAQMQRNHPDPPEKLRNFLGQLLPRLRALPGVQAAGVTSTLPMQQIGPNTAVLPAEGPLPPPAEIQVFSAISITPEYFRTARTRILKGREFNEGDKASSPLVAVVSQEFARQFFKGDALGKKIRTNIGTTGIGQYNTRTIVGVAQDVRYNGAEGSIQPVIYLPIDKLPPLNIAILLRTTVEPGSLSSAVRKAVTDSDPQQPLFEVQTMEERISQTVAQRRLMMLLLASFAALALVLAGFGVYGVFTYWASQCRQEMGIRLALGSSRGGLLRLIVMQALRLIVAGGTIGMVGAWFLDRLLASMLVGVEVHDPVSLSFAWMLMTMVALLGSSLPAGVAARTDVISVLHSE
jgi:putative ABC transport system permease protein